MFGNVVIPSTDKEGRTIVSLNIDNLETNESSGFYGCPNVTSITTPKTLSNIGKYSFTNCSSLNKIVIEVEKDNFEQFNNLSSDLFDQNPNLKLVLRGEYTYNQNIKYITGYPWGLNEDQIVAENGDIPLTEKYIPNAEPKKSILYMASRDLMVKELDPNYKNGDPQLFIYPEPDHDKQSQNYILYRVLWDDERNERVWMRKTVTIVDDIPNTEWVYASDDIIQKGHPFWYYKS